jgi:hypothetical protein
MPDELRKTTTGGTEPRRVRERPEPETGVMSTSPRYSMVSNSVNAFSAIGAENSSSVLRESGFDDRCKEIAKDHV